MQEFLLPKKEELHQDLQTFSHICNECKNTNFAFLLTHGDGPGNIFQDEHRKIYLVDWDDIKLAPVERDTWFLKDRPGFLDAYKASFPTYQLINYLYYFMDHVEELILGGNDKVLNAKFFGMIFLEKPTYEELQFRTDSIVAKLNPLF